MSIHKPVEEGEEDVAGVRHEVIILDAESSPVATNSRLEDITRGECPICMEEDVMLFPLECEHEFCLSCLDSMCRNGRKECPNCRRKTLRIADPIDIIDTVFPFARSVQKQSPSDIDAPLVEPASTEAPSSSSTNKSYTVGDKLVSIYALNHDFATSNQKVTILEVMKYESIFGVNLLPNHDAAHILPHKLAELLCTKLNVAFSKKKSMISQRKECCSKLTDHFASQLK
jgi:hypothetical protein